MIMRPLVFSLYVDDVKYESNSLGPIMFVDDSYLFFTH